MVILIGYFLGISITFASEILEIPDLHTWRYQSCPKHCRTGSSDEVALLIAEFGLLDRQQAALLDAISAGRAALLDDDDLGRLAIDVPDLRSRLGIG